MKTIIAGSRYFEDYSAVEAAATSLPWKITQVVSGGAKGADALGEIWARRNNVDLTICCADWRTYGNQAGPMRNAFMVDHADALLAMPGGRGTRNCIHQALASNLRVALVGLSGTLVCHPDRTLEFVYSGGLVDGRWPDPAVLKREGKL